MKFGQEMTPYTTGGKDYGYPGLTEAFNQLWEKIIAEHSTAKLHRFETKDIGKFYWAYAVIWYTYDDNTDCGMSQKISFERAANRLSEDERTQMQRELADLRERLAIDGFCEVSWGNNEEENYTYWGKCLGCGFTNIAPEAKFCGGCGKVIGNQRAKQEGHK